MSTKYLDKIGLSYFWTKLKAWIASASSNLVHRTGDESVSGLKEFGNSYYDSTRPSEVNWESSSLIVRFQNYVKGSGVPEANKYANLLFLDKEGVNVNWGGRLGAVETDVLPSGIHSVKLTAYKNEVVDGVDTRDNISLVVGYDADGYKYATAPSTSSLRANGTDIVTRNWIPADDRIVHTSGDEYVSGMKFFTYDSIFAQSLSFEKGDIPQTDDYLAFIFFDKNATFSDVGHQRRLGSVQVHLYPDGSVSSSLLAYRNEAGSGANTYLTVGYDADGVAYGGAPSTSASRNAGTDIVTRDWIPLDDRIVHTSGNETVAGNKTFFGVIISTGSNPAMRTDGNDKRLVLAGGQNAQYASGAKLYLLGSSYPSGASDAPAGSFVLQAGDANGYKQLVCTPDGDFTWDGVSFMKRTSYERIQGTSSAHKNLDDYAEPGFYNVKTAYVDGCPSGIGADAVLLVYPWIGSSSSAPSLVYASQELTEAAASSGVRRWLRKCNNGTWSAWKQVAFADGDISGNAATATKLAAARTINGVAFDGSANITVADSTKLPLAGGTMTGSVVMDGNSKAFSVQNATYKLSLQIGSGGVNRGLWDTTLNKWIVYADASGAYLTGNASTASALQTARTLTLTGASTGSVSFDGSSDVSLEVLRKSCLVRNTASNPSAAPYYKIASVTPASATTTGNYNITLLLENAYSSTFAGILHIDVRFYNGVVPGTSNVVASWRLGNPSNFYVIVPENDTRDTVELWVSITTRYVGWRCTVLGEGTGGTLNAQWVLHSADSAGQAAALPAGWEIEQTVFGVDTVSAQTINGVKTFVNSPYIKLVNPYIQFVETDWAKGDTTGNASWQGLRFRDKNEVEGALITYHYAPTTQQSYLRFSVNDMSSASASSSGTVYFLYVPTYGPIFRPSTDNTVQFGTSSYRWKEMWCNQSSINTASDERLKTDIESVSEDVLDAWADVSWRVYRWKDAVAEKGGAARFHAGAIAQQIGGAFARHGLDASRYGFFLHDEWDAEPEERDPEGNLAAPAREAGDAYGLRYVEALCIEAAYLRRENARLKDRVSSLEDRLAALEMRVAQG